MDVHSWHLLFDHFQNTLIHGPNIPGFYAILLFIASDFTSISSHIHNWVLFLIWLHLFILSEVISPWISSSILGIYWPREFIFQCPIFLAFNTVHGVQRKEYWSGLPFASPVDYILSELSTMTCLSWVALHGMAHSFIEPDKFQDGGLEGCVFLLSWKNSKITLEYKNFKITTRCWTTIDRKMLDPTKKRYPTSKGKGEAQTRW